MTIPMTRSTRTASLLRPVGAVSGTMPARDLHATRRFYEEALGLQTRRPSADRLLVRLGYDHVYEIEVTDGPTKMPLLAHNGINARGDIVEQHARLVEAMEEYGIRKLTRPAWGTGRSASTSMTSTATGGRSTRRSTASPRTSWTTSPTART